MKISKKQYPIKKPKKILPVSPINSFAFGLLKKKKIIKQGKVIRPIKNEKNPSLSKKLITNIFIKKNKACVTKNPSVPSIKFTMFVM